MFNVKSSGFLVFGAWLSACGMGDDLQPPLGSYGPDMPDDSVVVDLGSGSSKGGKSAGSTGVRSSAGAGGQHMSSESPSETTAQAGAAGGVSEVVGASGGAGGHPPVRCAGRPDQTNTSGGAGSGGQMATGGNQQTATPNAGQGGSGGTVSTTGGASQGDPTHHAGTGAGGTAGESGSTAGAAGAASSPTERKLFFSEYVEGSSKFKALEIYASTTSQLDGCIVATYFNGKREPSSRATLKGQLAASKTHVLCSSDLQKRQPERCNQVAALTFNGDDAIALECDGKILDVIGVIGVDPGDSWQDETTSTATCTLRRTCTITNGDSNPDDAFAPSTEWLGFPVDTFDDLGTNVCSEIAPSR